MATFQQCCFKVECFVRKVISSTSKGEPVDWWMSSVLRGWRITLWLPICCICCEFHGAELGNLESYEALSQGERSSLAPLFKVVNVNSKNITKRNKWLGGFLALNHLELSNSYQKHLQQWHKDVRKFFSNLGHLPNTDDYSLHQLSSIYWRKARRSEETEVETIQDRFNSLTVILLDIRACNTNYLEPQYLCFWTYLTVGPPGLPTQETNKTPNTTNSSYPWRDINSVGHWAEFTHAHILQRYGNLLQSAVISSEPMPTSPPQPIKTEAMFAVRFTTYIQSRLRRALRAGSLHLGPQSNLDLTPITVDIGDAAQIIDNFRPDIASKQEACIIAHQTAARAT
ncbi:hypothetical protein CIRG_00516 [Coccidioides immitis RMSCC 2394]|uniref:Uncharacterized protein n=1 Tax=Coccidioides immitis RMSCC 2394 TaxID=404692 RepID=A0A0J6Y010_COCIT|nr:hypothetical protein CIRG_00516 [Coccidioides immitis RMSCC 2394]